MEIDPADLSEFCDAAAGLLSKAKLPLICGLTDQSVETQQAAVQLAKCTDAAIDWTSGNFAGAVHSAMQQTGLVSCTFGEIRQRADLVVMWSADIAAWHPGFITDYVKEFVAIGPDSETTRQAATPFNWDRKRQIAALRWMRSAGARASSDSDSQFVGECRQFKQMVDQASYPVIVIDETLASQIGDAGLLSLFRWVRLQNDCNQCRLICLSRGINSAGIQSTLSSLAGFPFGVAFRHGEPFFRGREFSVENLIRHRLTDLILLVGSPDQLPASVLDSDEFASIPKIHVSDCDGDAELPGVLVSHLVARFGDTCSGTLIRDDGVPVACPASQSGPLPAPETVLDAIARRQD